MSRLTLPKKSETQNEVLRRKAAEVDELMENAGYNPLEAMIDMALDKNIVDPELKFKIHKELANYKAPKLRSVDMTGSVDHSVNIQVINFNDTANQVDDQHGRVIDHTPNQPLEHDSGENDTSSGPMAPTSVPE